MAVRPIFRQPEKEIFPRHRQHFARFQPRVQFLCGNAQVLQPEPVEKRPLVRVQRPLHAGRVQIFPRPAGGGGAFRRVKRLEQLRAEFQNFPALDPRQHDLLADGAVRQARDRRQRGDGRGNGGRRDDDARARAGQSQFGQTQRQNGVRRPEWLGRHKQHARKRRAVGVVQQQRDAVLRGQRGEPVHLRIRQHVARGIRRARRGDGADVAPRQRRFHGGEINRVLENILRRPDDVGAARHKKIRLPALLRIADVFRRERQENFLFPAAGKRPRQQIEQKEKRRLPAVRHRQIFRADVPAEFPPQQRRQRREETRIPLRRIVADQQPLARGGVGGEFGQAGADERWQRGDHGGIAAAEHPHLRIERERAAHVIHQREDAAAPGQFLADEGKFKRACGCRHS